MSASNRELDAAIIRKAAEWYVTHRGTAPSEESRAEFVAWLKSSPRHIEEYLKTAVISRDLVNATRGLDTDIEKLLSEPSPDVEGDVVSLWGWREASRSSSQLLWWRSWRVAAVAAAAVVLLCGALWMERDGRHDLSSKRYATHQADERSWTLSDGTIMNLDSNSSVVIRYTSHERLVQIEQGQALFRVSHETRRFRVLAGGTGVVAVGTEFDVVRQADSTRVMVIEGKVAIITGNAPPAISPAILPAKALPLSAGEQIQITDNRVPASPSLVNVQQAVAWTRHPITFDQKPLGSVTEEFNRYSGVSIVIDSAALRTIPISGVFNAGDTESFIRFMSRLEGVEIERTPEKIIIRRKSEIELRI